MSEEIFASNKPGKILIYEVYFCFYPTSPIFLFISFHALFKAS